MATTLVPYNSGCFTENSRGTAIPHQRGMVVPVFDIANEKMGLRNVYDIGTWVVPPSVYSDYINGSTGNAFATFAELITFAADNLYKKAASGSSTDTTVQMLTFNIVAVPAGGNQRAPGNNIDVAVAGTYACMAVAAGGGGGTTLYFKDVSYSQAGTVLTFTDGGSFLDGDTVIVFNINNY